MWTQPRKRAVWSDKADSQYRCASLRPFLLVGDLFLPIWCLGSNNAAVRAELMVLIRSVDPGSRLSHHNTNTYSCTHFCSSILVLLCFKGWMYNWKDAHGWLTWQNIKFLLSLNHCSTVSGRTQELNKIWNKAINLLIFIWCTKFVLFTSYTT